MVKVQHLNGVQAGTVQATTARNRLLSFFGPFVGLLGLWVVCVHSNCNRLFRDNLCRAWRTCRGQKYFSDATVHPKPTNMSISAGWLYCLSQPLHGSLGRYWQVKCRGECSGEHVGVKNIFPMPLCTQNL